MTSLHQIILKLFVIIQIYVAFSSLVISISGIIILSRSEGDKDQVYNWVLVATTISGCVGVIETTTIIYKCIFGGFNALPPTCWKLVYIYVIGIATMAYSYAGWLNYNDSFDDYNNYSFEEKDRTLWVLFQILMWYFCIAAMVFMVCGINLCAYALNMRMTLILDDVSGLF